LERRLQILNQLFPEFSVLGLLLSSASPY